MTPSGAFEVDASGGLDADERELLVAAFPLAVVVTLSLDAQPLSPNGGSDQQVKQLNEAASGASIRPFASSPYVGNAHA